MGRNLTIYGGNLLDLPTVRRLKLQTLKLPENVFFRTISGSRLPIVAKTQI